MHRTLSIVLALLLVIVLILQDLSKMNIKVTQNISKEKKVNSNHEP